MPCEQCKKRSVHCDFDVTQQKVLVTQRSQYSDARPDISRLTGPSYITELQRRAAVGGFDGDVSTLEEGPTVVHDQDDHENTQPDQDPPTPRGTSPDDSGLNPDGTRSSTSEIGLTEENGLRSTPAVGLTNPLDPVNSDGFTLNNANRRYFLGVSSNWSFGRRVLNMVHRKIHGSPLPPSALLMEGLTYDLGWDGQREAVCADTTIVPSSDFATYLINSVKFHCGRLFHMFDEATFMYHFGKFYENREDQTAYPRLWYIHFLIILAFGKAFIVRSGNSKRPPGADLFVQAMQLLPDVTFMFTDTVQSIEILCCAALYLQCLDIRSAAYTIVRHRSTEPR